MQNSRHIKILVSIILCIVFASLSHFTSNNLEKGISVTNVGTIERTLHKLQKDSREILNNAFKDTIAPLDKYLTDVKKNGLYFFVTDTLLDEIIYWSENIPITESQLKNVGADAKYMFLGNGWFVTQSYSRDSLKYISLILIEKEYSYQNRLIRNGPNPIFNFPKNIIIQPLGADIGIPVNDIDNVPLFIVNSDIPSVSTSNISLLFRWLSVMSICFLLIFAFCNRELYAKSLWSLLIPFGLLLSLRIVLFENHDFFCGDLYLFSPMLYADSALLSSLGDLLLHLIFLFLFEIILFSAKDAIYKKILSLSSFWQHLICVIFCVFNTFLLFLAHYTLQSLAFNSEISFKVYNIGAITIYTFIAYFIVALAFALLCVMIYLSFDINSVEKRKQFIINISIPLIILILLPDLAVTKIVLFAAYIFISYLFAKKTNLGFSLPLFVWLVVIISFYVSFSLIIKTTEREHQKRKLLAQGLLSERDLAAEMLLKDIEDKISSDAYIQNELKSDDYRNKDYYRILTDRYFKGYFQRYKLTLNVCRPGTPLLFNDDEDKEEDCLSFYMEQKEKNGIPLLGSSHFWFMNNYYFGYFKYPTGTDTTYLFLELDPKPEAETTGYPELLQIDNQGVNFEKEGYSYAKYSNKKLVTKFGEYDYQAELSDKICKKEFFNKNGYSHYIYSIEEGNAVILSFPLLGFSGVAAMFSYSFVMFILFLFALFTISGLKLEITTNRYSYKWKISIAILTAIIGALTSLTIAMLIYTIGQSERKNVETIQSKMQSIIIFLDQYLYVEESITPEILSKLDSNLMRLSNAFYTDLNIYDMSGNLITTSRSEIFERKLIGAKINRQAFYYLDVEKIPKIIHIEQIGNVSYYSSYATYDNRNGEAMAYINISYFTKPSEFRNELLSLTGAIMNIYIFLIVVGIALSVFISNQITQPLNLVRQKMARLNLTEKPETINYKGNNELGDLVREYNRMVEELARSAKMLAENERESAWREMARQIAHEIKNPLTPMKLNIQLAMRMKEQNRVGWQAKMDEAINSTLQQIDILSQTASEFSDFARTYKVELEPVSIVKVIDSSISLFSGYKNISIEFLYDINFDYAIRANKIQLQRVFTNIIKNSIQATEQTHNPKVEILLDKKDNYIITIKDNGVGISKNNLQNLFTPNFTTKSGGTGLGLAISKGIIESFGGTIKFIPQEIGACIEITFSENSTTV